MGCLGLLPPHTLGLREGLGFEGLPTAQQSVCGGSAGEDTRPGHQSQIEFGILPVPQPGMVWPHPAPLLTCFSEPRPFPPLLLAPEGICVANGFQGSPGEETGWYGSVAALPWGWGRSGGVQKSRSRPR